MSIYWRCDNHLGLQCLLKDLLLILFMTGKSSLFFCLASMFVSHHLHSELQLWHPVNTVDILYLIKASFVHWMLVTNYWNFVAFSHILQDMSNGLFRHVLTQLILWTVSNAKIFITHRWVRITLCCCEIEIFFAFHYAVIVVDVFCMVLL